MSQKLFESVLVNSATSYADCERYQFGFKARHSTGISTKSFKQTVDYYVNRGSHVFCSFIDFNEAFDSVNYWQLFSKLLDDNIDANVAGTLAYWYSNQQICVRWLDSTSNYFTIGNGTRQGSVLSPYLFCRYIRELLAELSCSGIGCNIGGMVVNVLAYADDLVLLALSWRALQQLLDI